MISFSEYVLLFGRFEFLSIQYGLTWASSLFFMFAIICKNHPIKSNIFEALGMLFVFSAFFHCFS